MTDWDTTAANNTDIGGINIAEGCPAAGINNGFREMMAQLKTYLVATFAAYLPLAGGTMTGAIAEMGNASTIKDATGTNRKVGYRGIPLRAATSQQTLALTDVGTMISITTGGIIVPANSSVAFSVGDVVAIYNNSGSSQAISVAVGVTLRLAGSATTGARTLAQRGFATLTKVATDEWIISGAGAS
ncbi:hypothetical protein [Sphingomonas sp. Root1294]|uniref:hypothetical protein n=1 Tax=Sphingomonas sp. Root1294 TaxID=1736447 RepID=UPI0006F4ED07|nr:hypothetical protein [Sphingomonas sp. Root1294]KQX18150.1 hypothetical protein ASD17_20985 [Sphingomonas sp. Root1294]KQY72705.1 hypothetical protein ASD39_18100 [Sphingomonas sp. Root50]